LYAFTNLDENSLFLNGNNDDNIISDIVLIG